jgi:hypothetical protein
MDYYDVRAVSNTSLNYIDPASRDGTPEQFRAFLEGRISFSTSSTDLGGWFHAKVLEPERFIYAGERSLTSGMKKVLQFLRAAYPIAMDINEIEPEEIVQACVEVGWGKSYSKNDRIQKITEHNDFFLMAEVQDAIICPHDKRNIIEGMYDSVVSRFPEMVYDVDPATGEELECINEQEIFWKERFSGGSELPCKAKLDRIFLNHATKTAWIKDLKSTSSIAEFNRSVEKYHYYRQKVWYLRALRKWLFQRFGEAAKQWRIRDMSFVLTLSSYPYISQEVRLSPMYDRLGKQELRTLLPLANAALNHNATTPKTVIYEPSTWALKAQGVIPNE